MDQGQRFVQRPQRAARLRRYSVASVAMVVLTGTTVFAPLWLAFGVLVASIAVNRAMKRSEKMGEAH